MLRNLLLLTLSSFALGKDLNRRMQFGGPAQSSFDITDVILDPPASSGLTLDGSNPSGNVIKISLKDAPIDPVEFKFISDLTTVSDCGFTYDSETFSGREITINPFPCYSSENNGALNFTIDVIAEGETKSIVYPLKNKPLPSRSCLAWGDPHISPFDQDTSKNVVSSTPSAFSIQAEGYFYLLRSKYLAVQVHHISCGNGVYCIDEIAFSYGADNEGYVFKYVNGVSTANYLNQPPTRIQHSQSTLGSNVNVFTFTDDLSTITINEISNKYFNIDINLSPIYRGSVFAGSLCGNYDDNLNNDIPSSTASNNWAGSDYSVGNTDNIFSNPQNAQINPPLQDIISTSKMAFICDADGSHLDRRMVIGGPAQSTQQKPLNMLSFNLAQTVVTQHSKYQPNPTSSSKKRRSPTTLNKRMDQQTAQSICSQALDMPVCDQYAAKAHYVETCVQDTVQSQTNTYIESTKAARISSCIQVAGTILGSGRQGAKDKINKQLGIGSSVSCPSNCSGKGSCTNYGCKCNDGFSGISCSVQLPQ